MSLHLYSSKYVYAARDACCNAATPALPSAAAPVSNTPAAYSGPVGNEGICNICKDGSYPGNPYAFIVARYVGEYTCDQLYGRGLHGMIPNYMCGPLQDFAQSVCGCSTGQTYSLTAAHATTYSGTPGTRNLRGGAVVDSKEQPSPENFHFEARELPADYFTSQTAKVAESQAATQDSLEPVDSQSEAQKAQQ